MFIVIYIIVRFNYMCPQLNNANYNAFVKNHTGLAAAPHVSAATNKHNNKQCAIIA